MLPLNLIGTVPDVVVRAVAIVLIAVLARWLVSIALGRAVRAAVGRRDRASQSVLQRAGAEVARTGGWNTERYVQRTRTLASLLGSIASLVIVVVAVLMIMDLVGLPLTPILASAGIGGVAIGIGAQSLVKDFLGGVFMIFEDQYGVGDRVTIGTVTGVIDEVTLRVTTIRDDDDVIWYLRNGDVSQVGNRSQGPERPHTEPSGTNASDGPPSPARPVDDVAAATGDAPSGVPSATASGSATSAASSGSDRAASPRTQA